MPSDSSNTSWNDDDPLDVNLARMVRDQIQAIAALAEKVEAQVDIADKPSEKARLYRAAMAMRKEAANVSIKALDAGVSKAIPRKKKEIEA